MKLDTIIKNRKSIRKYKNIDITNETIEELINCARFAPSAKNRQPWKFVIVKNKVKNEIADIMLEQEKQFKIGMEKQIDNAKSSVKKTALIIKQAPILILVFRPKDRNWIIGDSLSIGAAIEHICLKATDLGLGSLWIRDIVYTQDKIAHLVKKDEMELICAISIGYSDESPRQRLRKKLKDIIEWY